ncbi:permease [Oscillibacter hominis]|uniref:Permease n=1 Tax=Oscillibacter hominis TaxID=2763056 RepID=A0A7G9B3F7_9FIRM|nr:permease [Oscillibacter hominis]QNL44088.1 permease [Oscillibacter hominis]
MFTKILYGIALLWFFISFIKDKEKTKLALKKAWRSFENILPSVLAVLLLIGFILTLLDVQTISTLLGTDSGIMGMIIAAVVGCITLIPGFVALPLAASLLAAGAGYAQIAIFISTLMMVGIATLPLEIRYFGKRAAIKRNVLSLLFASITSCVIGVIM